MIAEYLSSLLEGRMVFITIISLVVGYSLGWARVGPLGAVLWIAFTLFIELLLWITSYCAKPQLNDLIETPVPTEVPLLAELMRILDHLSYRHRVLTRLMCETGLRPSEAMQLCWAQVDLVRKSIKIADTHQVTPKTTYSNREVMIGAGLAQDLAKLDQDYAHVFPGFRDPHKPMDNYRKALKTAVIKSGVLRYGKPIRFTPKFGRKAFTSYQWVRGTPLELIRKMVGHSPNSRVTEKNYLHMPAESVRDAVLDLDILAKEAK